ncbi:Fur family transcriptional regulator [Pararhodobacter sp. SW119]|uniref:Fur family transcriptional regulator n=1 Tax=Pararhodobacter sp. SW119 TaxID=2780075 RepID=UPI001AE0C841|nr:Fur family transcriptional regulator [Pararhodobacter sp. SW119]
MSKPLESDHGAQVGPGPAISRAEVQLRAQGLRLTPVRRRTLEILLEASGAIGAYDVLARLAADGFGSQPPVAYRALDFLVEHGLAHRLRRINAFTACSHPGETHHAAFLICRICRRVDELHAGHLRQMLVQDAHAAGFAVERTSLEASGLCADCQGQDVSDEGVE